MNKPTVSDSTPLARHFLGAYRKGRAAYDEQGPAAKCPYREIRGGEHLHIITFSRAYQRFWREGFEDQRDGLPERYRVGGDG